MHYHHSRKESSPPPLTLKMLIYFTNKNHSRWLGFGSFNKFKGSILASRIEKTVLK